MGVEDGWGQVWGHKSVFFMLQIRNRCLWDYAASVIIHPTVLPPSTDAHAEKVRKVSQRFQLTVKLKDEQGASVTDVMSQVICPIVMKTEMYKYIVFILIDFIDTNKTQPRHTQALLECIYFHCWNVMYMEIFSY